jgi:hypothetical protein
MYPSLVSTFHGHNLVHLVERIQGEVGNLAVVHQRILGVAGKSLGNLEVRLEIILEELKGNEWHGTLTSTSKRWLEASKARWCSANTNRWSLHLISKAMH